MHRYLCGILDMLADGLATVVDVGDDCPGRAGDVDRREPTLVPQEAVERAAGVDVLADDLAAVVDAEGLGLLRAGQMDRREQAAPLPQEAAPVGPAGNGRDDIAVVADDLAAVVQIDGSRVELTRKVDPDEPATAVTQISALRSCIAQIFIVSPGYLTAVIDGLTKT